MQEQSPPTPPVPPQPPLPPEPVAPTIVFPGGAGPSEILQALKAQRTELARQLERLEDRRGELSNRLEEPMVGGADRKGLEARISDVDQRITSIDKELAQVDAQIARAAGVPGAVVPDPPPMRREGPPEEVFVISGLFIVFVMFPLAIAYARRLWRRGTGAIAAFPAELAERFTRLEQGMDAIAVEVERIGEGQRFMARLLKEDGSLRSLGAGAAEPVEVKARESLPAQARR